MPRSFLLPVHLRAGKSHPADRLARTKSFGRQESKCDAGAIWRAKDALDSQLLEPMPNEGLTLNKQCEE
jgi:hypothetical protein